MTDTQKTDETLSKDDYRYSLGYQFQLGINRIMASDNPAATLSDIERLWGKHVRAGIEAYVTSWGIIKRDENNRVIKIDTPEGRWRLEAQEIIAG